MCSIFYFIPLSLFHTHNTLWGFLGQLLRFGLSHCCNSTLIPLIFLFPHSSSHPHLIHFPKLSTLLPLSHHLSSFSTSPPLHPFLHPFSPSLPVTLSSLVTPPYTLPFFRFWPSSPTPLLFSSKFRACLQTSLQHTKQPIYSHTHTHTRPQCQVNQTALVVSQTLWRSKKEEEQKER